ncbi:MAG: hypothetical protein LLG01_08410 [Planctomycetaceae bacterium]|nr:hypothetical protein [Planctomycetaceae bacterium]
MKNHLLIMTAAAIAFYAIAVNAQTTAAADTTADYSGVIMRIDPGNSVVIKVSDKEISIPTDSKTVILIDGKEGRAINLAKNMPVTVRTINGTAVRIVATTPLRPVE